MHYTLKEKGALGMKVVDPTPAGTPHRSQDGKYEAGDDAIPLHASLPALYGPHADRLLVQMLRELTRGHAEGVVHATHPEYQPIKS